jgi:segregation and condensation protein B
MSLKAKVEALIYATEEPVTLNQIASLLKDAVLAELHAEEEARLALNEIVSDGKAATEDDDDIAAEQENASDAPAESASQTAQFDATLTSPDVLTQEQQQEREKDDAKRVKEYLGRILAELTVEYSQSDRGMEIRQIAGGYRMGTKPEHHDAVVNFAKSLKPPVRLSMQALETLAVIAYKQPVTVPEISEIRGVDSSGVIATLLDRKLITTSGRKQVIGRPILYKTTKEFLLRFGLNNVAELPSMEEFEKLGDPQAGLFETASEQAAEATGLQRPRSDVSETGHVPPEAEAEDGQLASPDEKSVETLSKSDET